LDYDYLQLFQAIGDCIETNIPDEDIKQLIQFQIYNMPKWSMESTSVTGSDGHDYSYYSGQKLYVMYPGQTSIDAAKERIRSVYFD
jgi:anionic cell wall polymer biosynthesis LytR-Cps2A-Psr (LCP) family protein